MLVVWVTGGQEVGILTFFDTIFLGALVIRIFVLSVHAIGTGIKMVLVATTLGGLGAFCEVGKISQEV